MIVKACSRCGKFIKYGKTYCPECQEIVEKYLEEKRAAARKKYSKEYNKKYNQQRDKKYTQFYNSPAWKVLSRKYTQDKKYRCEECGQIATQVHHKKPIQTPEGWNLRLDYHNLELLCTSCHNQRHDRFKRKHNTQYKTI